MSDPYFQQLFADRIGGANYGRGSDIYKFEKIKRAKRKAQTDFPDRSLIDFGISADRNGKLTIDAKRFEAAVAEIEWRILGHFAEDDRDHPVDRLAMFFDHGGRHKLRIDSRLTNARMVAAEPGAQ